MILAAFIIGALLLLISIGVIAYVVAGWSEESSIALVAAVRTLTFVAVLGFALMALSLILEAGWLF